MTFAGALELLSDCARDAARIRRGPLPAELRRKVIRTRTALGWRVLRGAGGHSAYRIVDFDVSAYSLPALDLLFRELFVELDYFFESRTSAPVIFDCGSNIGMAVLFFKSLYPDARIVAFEPAPGSFAVLEANVRNNGLAGVELHRVALGPEEAAIDFYEGLVPGEVRAGADAARAGQGKVTVQQKPLSPFITGPVDLLKLDVEGAESGVIAELIATRAIDQIDQMIIEYHHHIRPADDRLSEFLAMLQGSGFGYHVRAYLQTRGARDNFQDVWIHAYRK